MRKDSIFWGVFLVLLGGLFLIDNLGILPAGVNAWAIFWPLVLIGLGIIALMRATGRGSSASVNMRLPRDQAKQAQISIKYGAGELVIDDRAGPNDLLNGSFNGGVEHSKKMVGDEAQVELRMPADNWPAYWPFIGVSNLNWTVGINPEIPLILQLDVGASRNIIDLSNLQVKELRLSTGASATTINFPARSGHTSAWLKSGAASVDVNIPAGVEAKIRARGGLASINVDTVRFHPVNGEYQSSGYTAAENRVDIEIETGVGSVTVR